jgi:multiple sugar transport system permease protein
MSVLTPSLPRRRRLGRPGVRVASRLVVPIGVTLALLYTLAPFVWLLLTSFKQPVEIFKYPPTFLPQHFTLHNYSVILRGMDPSTATSYPVLPAFLHSCIVALATTVICTVVATCGGYSLARRRIRLMLWAVGAIFLMRTIPRISIAVPLYLSIDDLGLLDTLPGIVLAHVTVVLPLATFLMYSFLRDIPEELEDAAQIDGASKFTTFTRVVVPLAAPGIAVTAILGFILSYNEFLYSLIMVSTTQSQTLPVALSKFILAYGIKWNLLSAAGILAVLPAILFAFIVQRHIVRGLSMGAVK